MEIEPEDRKDIANSVGDLKHRTPATVTIVKRRQHFRQYERWCATRGLDPNMASASAIAAYVEDFAYDVSYSTHRNRIDSLRMTYASRGVSWPINDSPIRWALESVRYRKGARGSRPLSDNELHELAHSMAMSGREREVHDWALIAVASELALESSDVIRLRVADLRFDGVESVSLVGFGRSGTRITTAYAHRDGRRCAVRALRVWIDSRDPDMPTLFYRHDPDFDPRPLHRRDVNGIIMRRMKAIGRTAQRYSAQSMTAYGLFGRGTRFPSQLHVRGDG